MKIRFIDVKVCVHSIPDEKVLDFIQSLADKLGEVYPHTWIDIEPNNCQYINQVETDTDSQRNIRKIISKVRKEWTT